MPTLRCSKDVKEFVEKFRGNKTQEQYLDQVFFKLGNDEENPTDNLVSKDELEKKLEKYAKLSDVTTEGKIEDVVEKVIERDYS